LTLNARSFVEVAESLRPLSGLLQFPCFSLKVAGERFMRLRYNVHEVNDVDFFRVVPCCRGTAQGDSGADPAAAASLQFEDHRGLSDSGADPAAAV
jgi:hypothetical protein